MRCLHFRRANWEESADDPPALTALLSPPARRRCSVAALDDRKRLSATTELGLGQGTAIHLDAGRETPGAIVVSRANHHPGPLERALKRNLGDLRRDSLAELGPKTWAFGGLLREWRGRRTGGRHGGRSLRSARRRAPAPPHFEIIAETAVPRRWVERPRRRIRAFGEDRDADDPHLARVAGLRRIGLGHGRKAECRRLLQRKAPAVDVRAAPRGHDVAALLTPVGGLAVDHVAPVHRDDGLDAPPTAVDDPEGVPLAEVAKHERLAVVAIRARWRAADQHLQFVRPRTIGDRLRGQGGEEHQSGERASHERPPAILKRRTHRRDLRIQARSTCPGAVGGFLSDILDLRSASEATKRRRQASAQRAGALQVNRRLPSRREWAVTNDDHLWVPADTGFVADRPRDVLHQRLEVLALDAGLEVRKPVRRIGG